MSIIKVIKTNPLFNIFYSVCWCTIRKIHIIIINTKWRRYNEHNYTHCINGLNDCLFPIERVKVGNFTYGPLKVYFYQNDDENMTIGNYCSIGEGVRFLLGGMHYYSHFSTFPFKAYFKGEEEAFTKGPIVIEDDVWIGADSLIMPGVVLRQGTVIAAGSIVVKSTEPYSIVGGNPAKLIKKRFSDNIIALLLKIEYSKLRKEFIMSNMDILYEELSEEVLYEIINKLDSE